MAGRGRRCARNAINGRPRASPRPRPEPDWAKPIITASERELRETSRPRMNMGILYSKKKPGRSRASGLRNDYLLLLALVAVFEDLAFFAVFTSPFFADFAEGVAG